MEGTIVENQSEKISKGLEKIFTPAPLQVPGCPVRDVLDRIGDKWSILSVLHLGHSGKLRFNELLHRIDGISQRMLTVTLRGLERDGFVSRRIFAEVPPRVEYELTTLGMSLLDQVLGLAVWAQDNMGDIMAARAAHSTESGFRSHS
ncbi:putative HTH-type transcriptional regulator ydeP [Fibrisoma limi BUZ 3]|uniref:Putative HTH-type transcriptional regulator ydeP n=1 Tax=Fibrisoma limi BUZ 3 TaxID=1185876 RepID=I2GH74_9BACT|nr:helix-turn-helix domain-containing protein [Fibrisoma limi]CCH53249.1 putative HTH-type transcriptional regulator ydeP [Fibrisoma limi BUZ 3]